MRRPGIKPPKKCLKKQSLLGRLSPWLLLPFCFWRNRYSRPSSKGLTGSSAHAQKPPHPLGCLPSQAELSSGEFPGSDNFVPEAAGPGIAREGPGLGPGLGPNAEPGVATICLGMEPQPFVGEIDAGNGATVDALSLRTFPGPYTVHQLDCGLYGSQGAIQSHGPRLMRLEKQQSLRSLDRLSAKLRANYRSVHNSEDEDGDEEASDSVGLAPDLGEDLDLSVSLSDESNSDLVKSQAKSRALAKSKESIRTLGGASVKSTATPKTPKTPTLRQTASGGATSQMAPPAAAAEVSTAHDPAHHIRHEYLALKRKEKLLQILVEMKFITDRLRREDFLKDIVAEWRYAATVLDRICLIMFTIFTVGSLGICMSMAPQLIV